MRLWIFLLGLSFAPGAFAFHLSPLVMRFSPAGDGAVQTLSIENPSTEKIAVQVQAFERKHVEGAEVSQATDHFEFTPTQLALKPGEKRAIRVSWKGEAQPARELSYRILASQLPSEFKGQSAPRAVFEITSSAYVGPAGLKSDVKASVAKVGADGLAEITLVNEGTRHRLMKRGDLTVTADGALKSVGDDAVDALNLLPGEKRVLKIPDSGLKAGEFEVRLRPAETE